MARFYFTVKLYPHVCIYAKLVDPGSNRTACPEGVGLQPTVRPSHLMTGSIKLELLPRLELGIIGNRPIVLPLHHRSIKLGPFLRPICRHDTHLQVGSSIRPIATYGFEPLDWLFRIWGDSGFRSLSTMFTASCATITLQSPLKK